MSEGLNGDYCCAFSSQLQDLLPLLSAEQKNDAKTSNKRATNGCEVLCNPVLLTHLTLIQAEPRVYKKKQETPSMKSLQDKLSAALLKVSEYRNQLQSVRQELKMAHKVVTYYTSVIYSYSGVISLYFVVMCYCCCRFWPVRLERRSICSS